MKKAPVNKTKRKSSISKKSDRIEKKHYTEKELAEFRKLILEKIEAAKMNREFLKSTLSRVEGHGTEDTSPAFKLMEDGSDIDGKEEIAQLAFRQDKFIQNLQNAFTRIANKTYGVCRVTGKLIPKERLLIVPHTTLCVDAKLEQRFSNY